MLRPMKAKMKRDVPFDGRVRLIIGIGRGWYVNREFKTLMERTLELFMGDFHRRVPRRGCLSTSTSTSMAFSVVWDDTDPSSVLLDEDSASVVVSESSVGFPSRLGVVVESCSILLHLDLSRLFSLKWDNENSTRITSRTILYVAMISRPSRM